MSDDCIFCRIARGDIPSDLVREDEDFIAFHDIDPKSETHVLVVPRSHHRDIEGWVAAGRSSDRMLAFVVETARDLGVGGRFRLVANSGPDAGQTVFHLHWHILAGATIPGF